MTGEAILKLKYPGDLFPDDESKCKYKYKELAKQFHPDVCKDKNAQAVYQHISMLYDQALKDIHNHTWTKTNYIQLKTTTGKTLKIPFLYVHAFELGEYYVCKSVIVYILNNGMNKYADNASKMVKALVFKPGKMEELKNFLPKMRFEYTLEDGRRCLVYEKSEDLYPLRAVLDYYNSKIPDKHVAWIINRLSNLACYLQYSGLVLNGIAIDSVFISPTKHAAALIGGWWYAVRDGEKMIGTTTEIFGVMPITLKNTKTAGITTDLEAIKLLGRTLLGESQPRKLQLDTSLPKPLVQFMTDGSGNSAFDEFEKYNNLLDKAYGKRVFIQMNITDEDVYKK